jgi:hypothetical protein
MQTRHLSRRECSQKGYHYPGGLFYMNTKEYAHMKTMVRFINGREEVRYELQPRNRMSFWVNADSMPPVNPRGRGNRRR